MRELHLFAGIGGGILGGMLLGHRCVCAVEWNDYCQKVLRARQADGCLEQFPIFGDIREFNGTAWRGRVDVICGGFPCQPWSAAGKRLGTSDPRHLWPEMARVVAECRPRFVFAENVALAAFEEPLRDLQAMGYRVPPALCLAAADVGAPHLRKRWWMLAADADSDIVRQEQGWSEPGRSRAAKPRYHGTQQPVANTDSDSEHAVAVDAEVEIAPQPAGHSDCPRLAQRQGQPGNPRQELTSALGTDWWQSEPDVGRVAHGVPHRVDRLRGIGNAQVPQVAAAAFAILMQRLRRT